VALSDHAQRGASPAPPRSLASHLALDRRSRRTQAERAHIAAPYARRGARTARTACRALPAARPIARAASHRADPLRKGGALRRRDRRIAGRARGHRPGPTASGPRAIPAHVGRGEGASMTKQSRTEWPERWMNRVAEGDGLEDHAARLFQQGT